MSDVLTVGNIVIGDSNVYVLDCNDDDAPEPDYESISIPGRSGDLHIWNNRWKNKRITYHCVCRANAQTVIPAILAQLLAQRGYQRIEDTFHTEYYKMGEYVGATAPVYKVGKDAARFDLTFDCKPQKWLKSGDNEQTLSSGVILTNPTGFPAYPLFKIQGYGGIRFRTNYISTTKYTSIGEIKVTDAGIAIGATNYLVFDCDINDAYDSVSNANYNNYAYFDRYWVEDNRAHLSAGKTRLYMDSSTMTVIMIPRWWTL